MGCFFQYPSCYSELLPPRATLTASLHFSSIGCPQLQILQQKHYFLLEPMRYQPVLHLQTNEMKNKQKLQTLNWSSETRNLRNCQFKEGGALQTSLLNWMRASNLSASQRAEIPVSCRLKSDELLPNPFSISDGDNNCIVKAAISYVAGGAMGGILAMFMSGVEMREIEFGKQRRSSKIILRKDGRRVMSSARGFASFGGLFVFNQCMLGHMRGKEDGLNSFGAGMAAAMISGANIMKGRELIWSGVCGGAICYLFYVGIKMMGYG